MFRTARPSALRLVVVAVAGSACASTAPKAPPVEASSAPPRAKASAAPAAPPGKAAPPQAPPAPAAASKEAPLKPAGPGARSYAAEASKKDHIVVPKDALRAGILKDLTALARREKRPRPRGDARLDAAMNDLAHNLRGDDLPAPDVVDFLLTHYGIVDPSPHFLLSRATAGADREIREEVLKQVDAVYKTGPVTRVGVGVDRSGDLMYAVVGLQETHVALSRVPRCLGRGESAPVDGKLIGRYREARLVVTSPDGKVTEQDPSARKGRIHGVVACAAEGTYQVEITAEDAHGSAVLANFPVYCGVEPPAVAPQSAGMHQPRLTEKSVEEEVLALVNRDRAGAGLAALAWDDKLAAIARAHSRDMVEHDFVGHVSPRTGTTVDRVHKAGLEPGVILENVATGFSAQQVESGFMASPGHRANVVDPRATRLGVGVALGQPVSGTILVYVTQLFTN